MSERCTNRLHGTYKEITSRMEEIHCIYLINVLRISLTYFLLLQTKEKLLVLTDGLVLKFLLIDLSTVDDLHGSLKNKPLS